MSTAAAPPSYPFDARPLLEPVDPRAARAHVQELRRSGRAPSGPGAAGIVIGVVVAVVFLSIFGSVFAGIAGSVIRMGSDGGGGFGALFAIVPMILLVAVLGVAGVAIWRFASGASAVRWYRLDRFAQANGMTWHPVSADPPLPGMVFSQGRSRQATDVIRGTRPRFVEFGNYRYTTGSGKNETTHHWGYVAVKLSTPLPHIVLDATSNNALFGSNLPASFDKSQRLSLEGDFDRHFSLYCPHGYEADALYLFTPDIMVRFIDHAAALDVEIVDDWLFLYAKREFSTLDPATWSWLFSVVGALIDKFGQWERWRDDRLTASAPTAMRTDVGGPAPLVDAAGALPFAAPTTALRPPPGVAQSGRRLRRGIPWSAIVVFGVVIFVWLLMQGGLFGGMLGGLLGGFGGYP